MSITTKDQKILWARAAGRCSIKNCRKLLVVDSEFEDDTKTLGEMAHIVGEKNTIRSPRGVSDLPIDLRNSYSNLILLCAHHHREIDKNWRDWSVELLHNIKAEHEIWVTESLSNGMLNPDELVYSTIIDTINVQMQLDHWNWMIEHCVAEKLPIDLLQSSERLSERLIAIEWPGINESLESSIILLIHAFNTYVKHFASSAVLSKSAEFLEMDKSYMKLSRYELRKREEEVAELWSLINYLLIKSWIVRLNEFVHEVRTSFNPLFHLIRGKFLLIDSLGLYNEGIGYYLLPESVETTDLNELIKRYNELTDTNNVHDDHVG